MCVVVVDPPPNTFTSKVPGWTLHGSVVKIPVRVLIRKGVEGSTGTDSLKRVVINTVTVDKTFQRPISL